MKNLPSMAEPVQTTPLRAIAALAEELDGGIYPGGGMVAALVACMAASLVAAAADRSRESWPDAGGVRAQAQALRRRALDLAERDAAAYALAREALGQRHREAVPGSVADDQAARDWRLGTAVERAAEPVLELAASAADIAELAAAVALRGAADVRADALVAAQLAAAATHAAAQLVQVNLVVGDRQPGVLARGYSEAAAAALAAAQAG